MNTKRKDAHRPSVINPDDYDYVACECIKVEDFSSAQFLLVERERIREHMAQTGGTYSSHEHGGNCHVCGSVNAIYTVLFYHRPSNTYVRTGTECAEKLGYGDAEAFRAKCINAREAAAGKKKAQLLLADRGLSAAWPIFTSPESSYGKYEETTVKDIVDCIVKYGSASDAQYAYVAKLLKAIAERPEREARIAAERAAALPVPAGRIEVCGTVVSVKTYDTDFGETLKMVVKADAGWCVFGTVPSSLLGEELRGKRVKFKATVTPSNNDPKFGFFKRPTGGAFLLDVPAVAV